VREHYSRPALPPTMSQLPRKPLTLPVVHKVARTPQGVELAWTPIASGGPFATVTSYAVYRFDGTRAQPRCAFGDAKHLIGTVRGTRFVDPTAQPGQRYTYYVTSLDRVWNESVPSAPTFVR
jgi:hypothetical protein